MKKISRIAQTIIASLIPMLAAQTGYAADVSDLGKSLTWFGAEAGANADGSIPAYEGGLPFKAPAGTERYEDPFAADKPLYTVTAQNAAQYAELLAPGTLEMLKRFPTYSINVYPTRRSMQYPEWYLENTRKNVGTARLEGKSEGDRIAGAAEDGLPFQGLPFPVPKTGYEVMWNSFLRYAPPITRLHGTSWLVDGSGKRNPLPGVDGSYLHPWSEKTGKLRSRTYDAYWGFHTTLYSPATSAGTQFLNYYIPDAAAPAPIWIYTPGQRRVRKAPEFAYDIPMAAYAGVLLWDEPWGFAGRMDRFDFKLVGKKEMIVPYNTYALTNNTTSEEALGEQHLKPETIRWEKRRVWIVESSRKADARHAYSKRTFQIEEDCWCIVGTESYDNGGALWRVQSVFNFPAFDVGGMNHDAFVVNDLLKGNYVVINVGTKDSGNYIRSYESMDDLTLRLTPQAMAGGSVR
ncbi:hypothetical protein D9M70_332620 [compost metagenome]